jgi:hypothetical protein
MSPLFLALAIAITTLAVAAVMNRALRRSLS